MQTTTVTAIHQLLSPDTVCVGLAGQAKEVVLNGLMDLLADHPSVHDLEGVRAAVFAREQVMSTGVGKGLALPHAKTPSVVGTAAALAITEEPVVFGAIDDQPVRIVFLLLGPKDAKLQHIKILSRISRLMNRDAFRERLLQAPDVARVLAIIEEGENELLEP